MKSRIKLSPPSFDGNEENYMVQALRSGQISTNGELISEFEEAFGKLLGDYQLLALNSGTSALHLALLLLGVGNGDEVICQSFTFCASANPVTYLGARPVFVDSETKTYNICPEALEEAILERVKAGKKPKAIIVVDLFGMPVQYNKILKLVQKYDIPLIEDAAEAVGSKYQDKYCGTFGDLGIFSFNGNKILSTGGGGGLITSTSEMLEKARYFSTQAKQDLPFYEHLNVGYNYRMTNLAAGIGLAQLEGLEQKVKKRRSIFDKYVQLLGPVEGISFLPEPAGFYSNRWLTTVIVEPELAGFSSEDLRLALQRENIESRFLWKPLHLQPVYSESLYYGGNVAFDLFSKGLCLPSGSDLTMEDQERIVEVIYKLRQLVSK